jgi:FemAB-related protein (PEP-CTERM system-associated)
MNVRYYTSDDHVNWNRYVDYDPAGTIFHTIEWKNIIEETFDFKSKYLLAEQNGEILGVLPLFHIKSLFAGNCLISTPFAVYGGILAKDEIVERALIDGCAGLAESLGVDYVEFRQLNDKPENGLTKGNPLYETFIKTLPENRDEIYDGLPREARRIVRKALANGLGTRIENSRLNDFYELYAISVRKFGTPVFPKSLFQNCMDTFKDDADLLIVHKDEHPIAGVLSFYYKNTAMPYYAGSLPEARDLRPNNLMYLALMEHAHGRGCTRFDFGRSKVGSGPGKFKLHMGFEPTPLPYRYYLRNGCELPNNNPTNPKYQLGLNLWKRLPLSVTKVIGPHVVRLFP